MTLGLIVLVLLAMFSYRFFRTAPVAEGDLSARAVGQDLITLADQLSRVTLSQEVFKLPGYRNLTDFSLPLPLQSFGRNNPFEIIGRD